MINQEIYETLNNDLYQSLGDSWRSPDSALNLIQTAVNPARLAWAKKIIDERGISPFGKAALEVGCGGGLLCEEICCLGFMPTGIDPSEASLNAARDHTDASGLVIAYNQGVGEALPYPAGAFDAVFCCDALEHVRDLPKVIAEISRVLKSDGIFFYDTINRTWLSKLAAIKIGQEWQPCAFLPKDLHVWEMFITPEELKRLLAENNLNWQAHRGMWPHAGVATMVRSLILRAAGRLSYQEFGEKLTLVESRNLSVMYMGYAIKASTGC